MTRKQQLEKELHQIIADEREKLIEKQYPNFKALEGKCFKYRNNFSCPKTDDDYWYGYIKVTKIEKSDMYLSGKKVLSQYHGWGFEQQKGGRIMVEQDRYGYCHSLLDYSTEITTKEFNKAWNSLLKECGKLH